MKKTARTITVPRKHRSTRVPPYVYRDESGRPLSRVVRGRNKTFWQERYQAGDWIGGPRCMEGVRRVIYRFPEVQKGIQERKTIHICEGEKDVDAIVRAGRSVLLLDRPKVTRLHVMNSTIEFRDITGCCASTIAAQRRSVFPVTR